MENPFSDEELHQFRQKMHLTSHPEHPQDVAPFTIAPGTADRWVVVAETITDFYLAECCDESTATRIVHSMNFAYRALRVLMEWRWRRVEDELPQLDVEWEDEDGDSHKCSAEVLIAYSVPYFVNAAARVGADWPPSHLIATLHENGRWYEGDCEAPTEVTNVIAWMPLPSYSNPTPSTCAEPITRDDQLQEAMEGRR